MIKIKNLAAGNDVNIGILQYITDYHINIETQISNIKAGLDTDIVIDEFFHKSPDYLRLAEKVQAQEAKVLQLSTSKSEEWYAQAAILQQLKEAEKQFRSNALSLADTFIKIKPRTERLKQARSLFEEGKFSEADKILREEDLSNDQDELFAQMDYYEQRQVDIFNYWQELLKN